MKNKFKKNGNVVELGVLVECSMQIYGKDISIRRFKGCASGTSYCNYGKLVLFSTITFCFEVLFFISELPFLLWDLNNDL